MKLLLSEDDIELSKAITKVLKLNKFDVDVVYNGLDAFTNLLSYSYDAAILDIMMPKLDGISVVKKIRSLNNKTPILLLTALSEIDDRVKGLDSGADDYLSKPFAIKELLARIRSITRRNNSSLETYVFGNTTLKTDTYELVNETSIRLTNKEFQVLELLINNQNSLLSTEKIMDYVWKFDSDCEINVVWVFISSLRKKLENIKSDYTIKAIRGVGYRLEKK